MIPGGHGNENPNCSYMNGRGFWLFYLLVLGGVHIILLSVPIPTFTVAWVWTITSVGHNAIQFWFLHWVSDASTFPISEFSAATCAFVNPEFKKYI